MSVEAEIKAAAAQRDAYQLLNTFPEFRGLSANSMLARLNAVLSARGPPLAFFLPGPVQNMTRNRVVPVCENRGTNANCFTNGTFNSKPACVNLGRYVLNDDAPSAIER